MTTNDNHPLIYAQYGLIWC